ncbi:hypothetical protein DXG03_000781 [Asterophora parasitica]|uniref:Pentatricopeptide repeat-containing protein-mitochondrial domain-containing protein n=1 Tax=Asterophora parasitica TaxID=117018 RepID=A0A9P7KCT2_9AGAR|nr:hypothetical protein DXG03_000781 [Asterophora parasitica]
MFSDRGQRRKDEHDKLKDLLTNLNSLIRSQKDPLFVDRYIHGRLDRFLPTATAPNVVYDQVISLLVERQHLQAATNVYQRMVRENFIPTNQTMAVMAAVALVLAPSDPNIIRGLDAITSDPTYAEEDLIRLLEIMAMLGLPSVDSLHVASVFTEARGEGYTYSWAMFEKLVNVQTRSGQLEDAFATIHSARPQGVPKTAMYAIIMQALQHADPSDSDAFIQVLNKMAAQKVTPDIDIFNSVISIKTRQTALHDAFNIYRAIVGLSLKSQTGPTPSTFGPLFNLLAKAYASKTPSRGRRRKAAFHYRRVDTVVSPRQLFRDLLFFQARRPTFTITAPLLNVALRAFVFTHDYIGAFLVLNTFRLFHLAPTYKTYHMVVCHLVNRVRVGRPVLWIERFMGVPSVTKDRVTIDFDELAVKLVESATGASFSLTGPLFETPEVRDREKEEEKEKGKNYTVPTGPMMEANAPVPVNMKFSEVPLQRLMRRAAFASMDEEVGKRGVSVAIWDAKKEMIPGKEHPYLGEVRAARKKRINVK